MIEYQIRYRRDGEAHTEFCGDLYFARKLELLRKGQPARVEQDHEGDYDEVEAVSPATHIRYRIVTTIREYGQWES